MKISSRFVWVAIGLVVVAWGQCPAQTAKAPLAITLTVSHNPVYGPGLWVDATVKNVSKERIGLWGSALILGEEFFDLDVRNSANLAAQDSDSMKRRRAANFVSDARTGCYTLAPGESRVIGTNLTRLFQLSPGTYSVQVTLPRFIVLDPGRQGCPAYMTKSEDFLGWHKVEMPIPSNRLTVTVPPAAEPTPK
jgi:hypothetical protein